MNKSQISAILASGLSDTERKLNARPLKLLEASFRRRMDSLYGDWRKAAEAVVESELIAFLRYHLKALLENAFDLRRKYAEYAKRFSRAAAPEDKERHILDFARQLGASRRQLRADRAAFARWFGHDAVTERYARRVAGLEREITFVLDRLGMQCWRVISSRPWPDELGETWKRLDLEAMLKPLFAHDGDPRVTIAAFRCLATALRALPPELQERSVDENTLQFIYRSAMHSRLETWLQCEALALLESLSAESLEKVIKQRLTKPAGEDDIFVRKRAVLLLGRNLARIPSLCELLPIAAKDSSPFVRQGFAAILDSLPEGLATPWLSYLVLDDPVPQVRGAALVAGQAFISRPGLREGLLDIVTRCMAREKDPFVLRVATHVAAECAAHLVAEESDFLATWTAGVTEALERLHVEAEAIPVRRWAALARERIWCSTTPKAHALRERLEAFLHDLRASERRRLPKRLGLPRDEDLVGRVLSVISQDDFPYEVDFGLLGPTVTRGHVFGFRPWRLIHEIRNPSPDKRQAFPHTISRLFSSRLRAPSAILCELAETRVPGEPLFIAEEGGWRPYVPLLDEAIDCLHVSRVEPVRIYTSEGVTILRPPPTLAGRLAAYWKLTSRFANIAKLRNWRSQLQESPASFTRALADLGFTVEFRPHAAAAGGTTSADPLVTRFFPFTAPLAGAELWARIQEYFVSVYDNSLFELALFITAALSLFVGRHVYANRTVRKWRRRVPLVIGGWGTRGKSGTERLKAALFNALGYGVVSKTTGCEAMFLCAYPFGRMREMFLFRSYDKATIWEQRNVLRLADELGADVFLWECMALTPSYVEVLQHHWVEDDISTITNTYPDHEDLQGPAGINIPEVIGIFTPHRSRVVTSEEVMLPILKEIAKDQRTALRKVTWLDAGLLAPDVLKRFPYDEHPNNVALVLALSDELGIDRDFTLKELADRVVPDLGVLKTSPLARVRTRRLQFSNGCSANERHGTLSNWLRCGFDVQDPVAEPGVWITTVVNNRADRVPRSRVFARILVEDIYADRHFLIGGNLTGLVGYVKQSWDAYAPTISLWPKDAKEDPLGVLREFARRWRLPFEKEHLVARIRSMVLGQGWSREDADALDAVVEDPAALREKLITGGLKATVDGMMRHHEANLEFLREHRAFCQKVANVSPGARDSLDVEFREFLWKWFHRKIYVVHDYYSSGDQTVNHIVEETPPGYLNRVMGIQNIKGTGLDFVYRWQAWDTCWRACAQLTSKDVSTAERGLRALTAFHEYGLLCEEHTREALDAVKSSPAAQSEAFQAELALVKSTFDTAMRELSVKLKAVRKKAGRFERAVAIAESVFDAGDAVRRRKLANRIYRDLVDERISYERAIIELQGLNKRQKGGWLLEKIATAQSAVAKVASGFLKGAK